MAYIGNTAASKFVSNRAASVYSGNGSTVAFTLEQVVAQDEDVLVSVDGVVQEPSVAYAVSSGTTLTFTAAPSNNAGNNIFVYYLASQAGTIGHPSTQGLTATTGTFTGNVVIPNGGNIGSAGDTDAISIASNGVVTFSQTPVGAGAILQVKYFQLTTSQTTAYPTTQTDMAIPNFNINITPASTSSIIKIECNLMYETANNNQDTMWFFYRDTTKLANTESSPGLRKIGIAPASISYFNDNSNSTPESTTLTYFDTPSSTSQINYKLGVVANGTSNFFINRTVTDDNSDSNDRGVSFISVTEIVA